MPELVAYLKPSHARPDKPLLVVRRLAFPKGVVPPQLVPYVEALKDTKARVNHPQLKQGACPCLPTEGRRNFEGC